MIPNRTNLRGGTRKKPKFESDNLEGQYSGNHLKEYPEVLSRLSHQAGSKEIKVSAAKLHNIKKATFIVLIGKGKLVRMKLNTLKRHFVQEGKREYQKNSLKV